LIGNYSLDDQQSRQDSQLVALETLSQSSRPVEVSLRQCRYTFPISKYHVIKRHYPSLVQNDLALFYASAFDHLVDQHQK